MIWTLEDARPFLAPYVNGGVCEDSEEIVKFINEATMILLHEGDWKSLLRKMRMTITRNCITLPREVMKVVAWNAECKYAHVLSRGYEWLEGGLGESDVSSWDMKDLRDLGSGFCTFADIDYRYPQKLIALSTAIEDASLSLHIRGKIAYSRDAMTQGEEGENLPIYQWKNGIEGEMYTPTEAAPKLSTHVFYTTRLVKKPVTKGYVTLYAYDPSTYQMWLLGIYHPKETRPDYRRYMVINHDTVNGDTGSALVKLQYVPISHDNDVLLIQNLPALKAMAFAIREQNAMNAGGFANYFLQAKHFLERQQADENNEGPYINVTMDAFALGKVKGVF